MAINFLVASFISFLAEFQPGSPDESTQTLSATAAKALTEEVTGIRKAAAANSDNQQLVPVQRIVGDDKTPFLRSQVVGKTVWHVVLRGQQLEFVHDVRCARLDEYTFDVYLDAFDGTLYKVVSRWPGGEPLLPSVPGAEDQEKQMRRSSGEKYHGFATTPPKISFSDALRIVQERGIGDPCQSKQIVAQYVNRSTFSTTERPVWAVTLWGIEPVKISPGVSVNAVNHIRNIVDAATAEWLGATTVPQPLTDTPATLDPYWEDRRFENADKCDRLVGKLRDQP